MAEWLKIGWLVMSLAGLGIQIQAQEASSDLQLEDAQVVQRVDEFGVEEALLVGTLHNAGTVAYGNINLFAEGLDADSEAIAEGFGYVVDACGTALIDIPLAPQQTRRFALKLDIYGEGELSEWIFEPSAQALPDYQAPDDSLPTGIQRLSAEEVVSVEWQEDGSLLTGVGCAGSVFTDLTWSSIAPDGTTNPLDAHPNASFVTDALIERVGINQVTQQGGGKNPALFARSFLTMPTFTRRAVWHTDLHDLYTMERDGQFLRRVETGLYQYSLQGFVWSPEDNFVAAYFGAFGEEVRYFTASADGVRLSPSLLNNPPSRTMPALTNDGRSVIIGATLEEQTGYWLVDLARLRPELLFEVDILAGNNYPAPAYWRADAQTRYLYVIRPEGERVVLERYHFETGERAVLYDDLGFLRLRDDERAWAWLSPDGTQLAVGRSGRDGGLWRIDLGE